MLKMQNNNNNNNNNKREMKKLRNSLDRQKQRKKTAFTYRLGQGVWLHGIDSAGLELTSQ